MRSLFALPSLALLVAAAGCSASEDLMAHEGNEPPFTYPSMALIQSTARYCKVMVVHSWFWPGGDRAPWKIPAFVPKDQKEFNRVRDDLHLAGMKMVPYFSPYYYSGKDFFAEVRRALDEYRVDGLYLRRRDHGFPNILRDRSQDASDARR